MDYTGKARALRAKAADHAVTPEERKILLAKAEELEAKYGKQSSPITDDTTTTSRDGRYNPFAYRGGHFEWTWDVPPQPRPFDQEEWQRRNRAAWEQLWNLHRSQEQWNRPHDEDVIYEEKYKYEPGDELDEDEDEGYEGY